MSAAYKKLLSLNEKEGDLSSNECNEINMHLSIIDPNSIPDDQYQNIKDYIDSSLANNSVSDEHLEPLKIIYEQICELQTS